jgi:menaquinol-cytochrome c reductase iron-sulfur subunit
MPLVDPHGPEQPPHAPTPSLWPVGFAIGIAIILTGVVIDWIVVALGAGIALVFGYLWAREVMGGAPAPPAVPVEEPALPLAEEGEIERFPRSKFLEGATLGLGGVIGGLVTVPALGLAVLPTFVGQEQREVDVGPLEDFPEGEWRIVTYMENPEEGEVTRRTAYVRYNGLLDSQPSLTILSNRCAHLGCPVQPSGPVSDDQAKTVKTSNTTVTRIPANPAAFACPCHGGAYDLEGNRTAGPPVRGLDRYAYGIRDGRVFLVDTFSVGSVRGQGKEAVIVKYDLANPGIHVDGPEQVLYPIESPR